MNTALAEMNDTTFYGYTALLALSGIIMLVLAAGGFGTSVGSRILSGLFGLGFFGYAIYLAFFFDGGNVSIFLYAFIVPILAIVNLVKSRKARSESTAVATPAPEQPAA